MSAGGGYTACTWISDRAPRRHAYDRTSRPREGDTVGGSMEGARCVRGRRHAGAGMAPGTGASTRRVETAWRCSPRSRESSSRRTGFGSGVQDHLAWDLTPAWPRCSRWPTSTSATPWPWWRRTGRGFKVFMGAIEESGRVEGQGGPPRHDQGGVSQSHFQHHHDLHVLWHLKRVAGRLAALFRSRPFDRLILAGPEDVISELRPLLPDPLARRVVATVPLETYANEREVLEKTLQIEARVEREVEERLLQELFETGSRREGRPAAWSPTLEALWLGEVWTLVVADGAGGVGSECSNCGRLEPGAVSDLCRACGSPMRPVHDVFHRAMARTIEQAGRVRWSTATRRGVLAGGGRRPGRAVSASGQLSPNPGVGEDITHGIASGGHERSGLRGRGRRALRPKGADEVEQLKCGCRQRVRGYHDRVPRGRVRRRPTRHPPACGLVYRFVRFRVRALDPLRAPSGKSKRYLSGVLLPPTRRALLKSGSPRAAPRDHGLVVCMRVSGGAGRTPGD